MYEIEEFCPMPYAHCACKFNDVEDDVVQWCDVHARGRDEAVLVEQRRCEALVQAARLEPTDLRSIARMIRHP